jgi:hypothetical protein
MKRFLLASAGLVFLAGASCGGGTGNSTPGTGGSNATAGTTGSAGTGTPGDAGTMGSAGTTGVAGTTGSAGTTGEAGTTGNAGTTGTAGTTGNGGSTAGTTGTAGRGGTTGTGGSTAGTTGTAGRGGTTGTGGTAGTTGSGGSAALTITSTQFGEFNNAFMITPCMSAGTGYDCPNLPMGMTSCPTAAWSYGSVTTTEATGNTYAETFMVSGGDPSKIYDVTVRVLGQAEGRTYTGGTRALSGNVDPNAATNNLLYTGGQPGTARVDYNVFQMTITPGTAGAIAGAPTYYAFNAVDSSHEGAHYNYGIDEMFTFKVKSGYTVTLTSHDSNCIAIKNCGPGGPYNFSNAAACEAVARSTPSTVTLPATFRNQTISSPMKFQTQFLNFKVMSIVAE